MVIYTLGDPTANHIIVNYIVCHVLNYARCLECLRLRLSF